MKNFLDTEEYNEYPRKEQILGEYHEHFEDEQWIEQGNGVEPKEEIEDEDEQSRPIPKRQKNQKKLYKKKGK